MPSWINHPSKPRGPNLIDQFHPELIRWLFPVLEVCSGDTQLRYTLLKDGYPPKHKGDIPFHRPRHIRSYARDRSIKSSMLLLAALPSTQKYVAESRLMRDKNLLLTSSLPP